MEQGQFRRHPCVKRSSAFKNFPAKVLLLVFMVTTLLSLKKEQINGVHAFSTATYSSGSRRCIATTRERSLMRGVKKSIDGKNTWQELDGGNEVSNNFPTIDGTTMTRRSALLQSSVGLLSPLLISSSMVVTPRGAHASDEAKNIPINASWNSVDGLNSLDDSKKFVSFDKSAYTAMINDKSRTPLFEKAIINRLNSKSGGGPESQVVLDLGTGPYAIFAIMAAQNGAKKVYAIEGNPDAARIARETVKKSGYDDVIEIIEGISSDITLPEKVDFIIAEIIGSVVTEEGVYATILDAYDRFVKEPSNPNNWIPSHIQTYAAPASYSLHTLFQPPEFDWTKLSGEPVRFNCRDEGLQLLADPIVVEDISFADIRSNNNNANIVGKKRDVIFTLDEQRIKDNAIAFYDEYHNTGKLGKSESEKLSKDASSSFTGIALWPRLTLGDGIEINSRSYPHGGHQRSHWQTVLPIMSPTPIPVKGGDKVAITTNFDISSEILKPSTYKIDGNVMVS